MKLGKFAKLMKDAEAAGGSAPRLHKALPVQVKGVDDDNRTITVVASTEDIDRDGDKIRADGWNLKEFKKNPVVPWSHNYGLPPVARAERVWVKDGQLMAKVRFPGEDTVGEQSFEDKIYRMYRDGFLSTFSVGFRPVKWEYVERAVDGAVEEKQVGIDFLQQELWEISACTIPSNPNAAMVRAKAAGILTDDDIEILEKWVREPGSQGKNADERFSKCKSISEALAMELGELEEPEEDEQKETTLADVKASVDRLCEVITRALEAPKHQPEPDPPAQGAEPDGVGDQDLKAALEALGKQPEIRAEDLVQALEAATDKRLAVVVENAVAAVDKAFAYRLGIVDPAGLKFQRKKESGQWI